MGYFYQEGKYIPKDLNKAVDYYKEASSFNDQHAKNNLGIIYKHGFGENNQQNVGRAIAYFEEAIRQSEDILSIYNLAHIYLFIDKTKERINESIKLLLRLISIKELPIIELLCIAMHKDFDFYNENIVKKLNTKVQSRIFRIMNKVLYNKKKFNSFYQKYENADFIYDLRFRFISLKELNEQKKQNSTTAKNITSDFYDGFGF